MDLSLSGLCACARMCACAPSDDKKYMIYRRPMSQNFYDKLDEYYRLKAVYAAEREDITKKIIQTPGLSQQEKREMLANPAKRPKCVGCRRPVGTEFTTAYDEKNDERLLGAVCGDKSDPCALKITLAMGDIRPLPEFIEEEEGRLKAARMRVIELKNQLLIGTVSLDDVLTAFEGLQEEINTSNQLLEYYLALYDERANAHRNGKRLAAVAADKFALKEEMRRAMAIFATTRNQAFVQEAVEIYVNQLRPLVVANLEETYARCEVVAETSKGAAGGKSSAAAADDDDDADDGTRGDKKAEGGVQGSKLIYKLYQDTVTPAKLEYTLLEPRVVTFNLGAPITMGDKAKVKKVKVGGESAATSGGKKGHRADEFVDAGVNFMEIVDDEI